MKYQLPPMKTHPQHHIGIQYHDHQNRRRRPSRLPFLVTISGMLILATVYGFITFRS
jgi:hypothetical protein